ncbi:MAG: 4Fe-4S binding protein [Gammaproteobacteria bacterium]|nr:4Fe-4S binding protein [Gammaproteobacteria bacterium]
MTMTHPGLPLSWAIFIFASMIVFLVLACVFPVPGKRHTLVYNLTRTPLVGGVIQRIATSVWVLLSLKLLMVLFFLTVIIAGLSGTPVAERNFATVVTWNLWWSALVFSIFVFGSAWCSVCPWDAIAHWLVRRRLWKRAEPNNSLNWRVPRYLNNVWPALILFIGLTWLELGVGITINPYATAVVALLMVVLATISLALFQRKAFCRNFCPVGRTVGVYSQLATVELRPIEPQICADCKTLECYHGNETIDACPTWLVMGRLNQNSYCTSCGNCSLSCPQQNIAWRLRSPSVEAIHSGRPHWDEAWFMLGLLALTAFHGITMMPFWEDWMKSLARLIGDSGRLLWSFSIGLLLCLAIVAGLYSLLISLTRYLAKTQLEFRRCFAEMAFVALPLAFSYHMAHNLNHLIREGGNLWAVITNPLGNGTLPLTMMEKHQRHMQMWLSQDLLYLVQTALMIFGFIVSLQIIRNRGHKLLSGEAQNLWGFRLSPILLFVVTIMSFHLWMLMQPMIMRM